MKDRATTQMAGDSVRPEDKQLIAACLEGDPAAWEALITRYKRLIYSIPIKLKLGPDEAADIFQSVCLKLYEKLSTLRDTEKLSSWLITTTTRECWRFASRRQRESQLAGSDQEGDPDALRDIPAPGPLADEQREVFEQQHRIREAIGQLPDRCRQLITMLFYEKEEPSYSDIASRMKMPVSSVGPTRARCLEKLKKLLGDII